MKVTLEINGSELALLYIATGNEDAGKILLAAAREFVRINPEPRKVRKKRRLSEASKEGQSND